MSGAFVKFKGLNNPKPKRLLEPHYPGIPCLHAKHSGDDGLLSAMRDSETHACLECLETIAEGRFGLDITRIAKKYRSRAYKFWSKVDVGEWNECWRWRAEPIARQLYHIWPRAQIKSRWGHHPIQVMMWLTWGDTGRLGNTSLCGERRCMNPLHNLPLDIRHSALIEDYDEFWLEKELTLFKGQLREYEFALLEKEQSKIQHTKECFDPTKSDIHNHADGNILVPPTPYEIAFKQMLTSIDDGTHHIHMADK